MSEPRLRVHRRALLVYLVTESFKERLQAELGERIARADGAIEALESMLKAAGELGGPEAGRLKGERDKLLRSREDAAARLAQINGVAVGSEIVEGSVTIDSEIGVGDSEARLRDAQIVIREGEIVELRNL